ncbi:hypothetical protein [Gloeothece verrucosa]|uniref:Uncharacterized protein n=1 Tax=Gloeothece verrucosa (strain PCC 7822) TaxID=497965 RepID=E0U793_GLOV7|nr:hypothetical protein [Gloeothece verrucosa]ADN12480.1 conserved hypothetical protein [Gloeothece verrucosa PCC 7822]
MNKKLIKKSLPENNSNLSATFSPDFNSLIEPLINLVSEANLKKALKQSIIDSELSLRKIEKCFNYLSSCQWSKEFLALFFNSWKSTHLKMLAIYALSCRLQRLALSSEADRQQLFFLAASYNAATSYEDLGLDFQGVTHAQLYDQLAGFFLGDFPWQLDYYCLPVAREFKNWIYQNMVLDDIGTGLLTNIFSEIYNHCEYSIALHHFSNFIDRYYVCSEAEKDKHLCYIKAHVINETEIDHFLVVFKALEAYNQATDQKINYQQARAIFTTYLTRVGMIMELLTEKMKKQINAAT